MDEPRMGTGDGGGDGTSGSSCPVHRMSCMEIWGGNRAIHEAVVAPGIEGWILSLPHRGDHAGGDVHYVSTCAAGKISRFAVADVSGHGAGVDGFARTIRGLMRRYINTPDQSRFARELNAMFARLSDGGVFATALLATYFAPTDQLIVVNAGHPRPMLHRARTGAWSVIDASDGERSGPVRNLPLGIIDGTEYTQFVTTLERGDEVVIVTDALVEARLADGSMVGEAGLLEVLGSLRSGPVADRITGVLDSVRGRMGAEEFDDDVTVMWLRHTGDRPARQGIGEQVRMLGRMMGLGGPV